MNEPTVAVVILNFNGKAFLQKFLPATIQYSPGAQIYVADNASSDDSVQFLKEQFPDVKLVLNKDNGGYARGYNEALRSVKADVYVLLNNDVEVSAGWLDPVISLMKSDSRIAVCQPKLLDYNQRDKFEYAGASGGFIDTFCYPFCRGRIFNSLEEDRQQYNDSREVFWATGACLFVRSDAYWLVNGFDEDYFAHMEEIDFCWRLKNLGHKIMVQPASVVYHVGGGTLNKFSTQKTFLNFRNNLITLTKNHPPRFLWLKILYRMVLDGVAAFKFLFGGQAPHFVAVIKAHFAFYGSLGKTLQKRKTCRRSPGFHYNRSFIYKGNIVFEYFLGGSRKFSTLKSGFFSE